MEAAGNSHTDIVRLLLDRGADVDLVDNVSAACVGPAQRTGGGCKGMNYSKGLNLWLAPFISSLATCRLVSHAHIRTYCTPRVLCGSSGARR